MREAHKLKMEIMALDDKELAEVTEAVVEEYKRRRVSASRRKAICFRPGQRVRFVGRDSARLPGGAEGVVRKVNTRTIAVDFGLHGHSWRVDAALLAAVV